MTDRPTQRDTPPFSPPAPPAVGDRPPKGDDDPDEGEPDGRLTPDMLDPFGETAPSGPTIPSNLALVPRGIEPDALLAADPLTAYLAYIRHLEPLPQEEQQRLAERFFHHGDTEAARLLILSNVRLVVKIAREYSRRRESLMELIQEGNVGLSEAIRRYDPYRGVRFTSYAQYWIRAMILNYLMNTAQPVRIGSTRAGRKLFFNLRREREKLLEETRVQPSTRLLADRLGVQESEVVDVMRVLDSPPLSLEAPAPGHERTQLSAVLASSESRSPEDSVIEANVRATLSQTLKDFSATIDDDRELTIWNERILADEPRSLQELGDEFGVSRERIRQIEAKLKKRVEMFLKARFGEDTVLLNLGA
ncbi:MAG: sigma-70 family RNA polymerase sigma factor [Bradymonadales bacterium]|nr:sigma-70 family RNA polymerase sigma factor [Bradymonadales bacterium]